MSNQDRIRIFRDEARALMAHLDEYLFAPDREMDSATVDILFRDMHTLKGGAGLCQLAAVETLAHELEDVLHDLRSGDMAWSEVIRQILIQGVGRLQGLINAPEAEPVENEGALLACHLSIRFPSDFFQQGGDPLGFLDYMQSKFVVRFAHWRCVEQPAWESLDPTSCFLGLEMTLAGEPDLSEVEQALDFLYPAPSVSWFSGSEISEDPAELWACLGDLKPEWLLACQPETAAVIASPLPEAKDNWVKVNRSGLEGVIGWLEQQLPVLAAQSNLDTRQVYGLVRDLRLAPLEQVCQGLERDVHETASRLGKQIRLKLSVANGLKADRTLVDMLPGVIRHLVRNAIDHGIEPPGRRAQLAKPEAGTLLVRIALESGSLQLVIEDDGAGLSREPIVTRAQDMGCQVQPTWTDQQVWQLLFLPGFSTAGQTSLISGRGVGLDHVRQQVQSLGGQVDIDSMPGRFTRFVLTFPDNQGLNRGLLVASGGHTFFLPEEDVRKISPCAPENPSLTLHALLQGCRVEATTGSCYRLWLAENNATYSIAVDNVLGSDYGVIHPMGSVLQPWQVYKGMAVCHGRPPAPVINTKALIALLDASFQDETTC